MYKELYKIAANNYKVQPDNSKLYKDVHSVITSQRQGKPLTAAQQATIQKYVEYLGRKGVNTKNINLDFQHLV